MKKPKNEDVSLDMTPMIDVVFQLIIFFVVTLKMSDDKDTTIKLADQARRWEERHRPHAGGAAAFPADDRCG